MESIASKRGNLLIVPPSKLNEWGPVTRGLQAQIHRFAILNGKTISLPTIAQALNPDETGKCKAQQETIDLIDDFFNNQKRNAA